MKTRIHTSESTFLRAWCWFNRICDYLKMDMLKQNSHMLIKNAGNRSENEFTRLPKMLQSYTIMQNVWKMNRICDYLKINILKQNSHTLIDNAGKQPENQFTRLPKILQSYKNMQNVRKMNQIENKVMPITFANVQTSFHTQVIAHLGFHILCMGCPRHLPIWPNDFRSGQTGRDPALQTPPKLPKRLEIPMISAPLASPRLDL